MEVIAVAGQARRASKGPSGNRESVKSDGRLGGYELPEGVLPKGESWHPVTRRWWDHWRASPQGVKMMTDPDWDFLLDTALIHHTMWQNGRWEFANEVRMRVGKFGATPEDRARLKIEVEVPEEFPVGDRGQNVTSIKDRRSRITKRDS